ncbi:TfoX/Sxy family DNA transformation protein [Photorhabdus tasmaniensis]|uniref:TfoX/Sxy family DNA transformation protein n=1 Tax=Photorhabdus tasmaniensis TaxID=1004159 RepID=UPI00404329AB
MLLSEVRFTQLKNGFSSFGRLTRKPQFGGYSLLADGIMFAIIADGELYLRGNGHAEVLFKARGMKNYIYSKKGVPVILRYYQVVESLWQDQELLSQYAYLAYYYSLIEMTGKKKMPTRLKDLPNLGMSLERQLWKVGICKVEDLRLLGAKASYLKLHQYKRKSNVSLLLALAGAIEGCHSAVLPVQIRNDLLRWHKELAC